jgi:hypothetical protein
VAVSWDATFTFDWETLDRERLKKTLGEVVRRNRGVVMTHDPKLVDPDPDTYVRPGYEHLDEDEDEDEDEDDEEVVWYFGFPGKRTAWASVSFTVDDEGCYAWTTHEDVDPACLDAFSDLFEEIREALGGHDED